MKDITIIFIDDEALLCEIFYRIFNKNGMVVKAFTDHEAALKEISLSPPDLIFIDYRLLGINGEEVAEKISPSIPKVLITGELELACTYPFLKILPKPTNYDEIQQIINSYR